MAVLPLRVRGSQRELRTLPPSTDSRLPAVFICHSDSGIWTWFVIWALAFELCLPFAPLHHSAGPQGSQKQMADDETNRMYFNNLIGRPTYEREHLNLGKTGDSHKTNPSQLRRVSRPAPTARENTWQTNETNRV